MSTPEELPPDGVKIISLLRSMSVTAYEPRVIQQLLDFQYRYTAECLQDAEAIAERSLGPRPEVTMPHVVLATELASAHTFTNPPSLKVLQQLAAEINAQALPEIKPHYGLRLPPEGDCLLAPNYQFDPRTPAISEHALDGGAAPLKQEAASSDLGAVPPT
ncbi:hypothetical protein ACKKBG_A29925 [Auxenochlorella protothecoides x Auxenochlorella symbiontica]